MILKSQQNWRKHKAYIVPNGTDQTPLGLYVGRVKAYYIRLTRTQGIVRRQDPDSLRIIVKLKIINDIIL